MSAFKEYFKTRTNNLERRFNAKTFNVDAVIETADDIRGGGDTYLQPDDILVIGTVPGGSLMKSMEVLNREGFDGTAATFDFYFSAEFPTLTLVPIATAVAVGPAAVNTTTHVDLPTSGQVNGTGIWLGDLDDTGDYYIVAQYKGTTESTVGDISVLVSYDRFATNEGAY